MAATIFRLGWTNPLTDAFGAHPALGPVLDLNDGVTFTLAEPGGIELSAPPRSVVAAGNPRTQGERASRALYRHNRRVVARLLLGPMAAHADLAANLRALAAWLNAPPTTPVTIQYQPPSASSPVYLDVVAAAHDISTDERDWLRLQMEPITLLLWCRPGLRGDRVTLSNLAVNPGFEQGSGPGVVAFADPLSNVNAYTVVSGTAPALTPANSYVDIVTAAANGGSALLRYYRMGESSGTVAPDISGSGQNGTYQGSFTRGAPGAIAGDTDTAITFASGGDISVPMGSGGPGALPAGANPWSIVAWVKIAANPGSSQVIAAFGTAAAGQGAHIAVDTTGKVYASVFGTNTPLSAAALSLNVWHLVVGTYDGTTLRCYLDNAAATSVGVTSNIGTSAAFIGEQVDGTAKISATIDEVGIYGAALLSAQVGTLYTAGTSGASGTQANAMQIPAGTMLTFGSPAWGALNTWQVRFRYTAGGTCTFFLHRTDGSNTLFAAVMGSALQISHTIAGSTHLLASAGVTLAHEAWYWLQLTQFPSPPGDPPYLSATLFSDDGGISGAQVAAVTGAAFDAVTALSGVAGLAASGPALLIGGAGNANGAGQQISLFGPGGWLFTSAGTGTVSGAWEQNSPANTAPIGLAAPGGASIANPQVPVQSYGAARMDFPPAGTGDGMWRLYAGGTPAGSSAIPASVGQVFQLVACVKSAGLDATASTRIRVEEHDASGAFLFSANLAGTATLTGNIPAWTTLWGAYTIQNAACAYLDVAVRASSTTTPGASAGATVWIDNVQVWNQTLTGVGSGAMPYCELRFPQSPAQLVVTGLLGDLPAPAYLGLGTYVSSLPTGGSLSFVLGRAAGASATARLVGPAHGYYGSGGSPIAAAALDAASYGGFYATALANSAWSPRVFSLAPADAPGVYHLAGRCYSAQSAGNLPNVQVRANVQQRRQPWYGQFDLSDQLADAYGPFSAPLSASVAWTVADAGQVTLPPFNAGALADPTQAYLTPHMQWVDNTPGGSQMRAGWAALLPIDGSLLTGVLNNPSNAPFAVTGQWVWAYFDGLLVNRASAADGPAWAYSLEAVPLANPAHAGGGPGTQSSGSLNINSGADPYLALDPQIAVTQTAQAGVNVLVGYLADANAAVLPLHAQIAYSPLYLWPR